MRDEMEIFILSTVPGKKPLTVLTMMRAPATLGMVPAITATTTATSLCCSAPVQVALVVRNLPADANQGDIRDEGLIPGLGRSPGTGNGDPLSILAWRIPWTEEPGGLQSTGWERVGHD